MSTNARFEAARDYLAEHVFDVDTRTGRIVGVMIMACVFSSVVVVIVASVPTLSVDSVIATSTFEWIFTIIFTLEYICRTMASRPWHEYSKSLYGIVDLVSILPSYIAMVIPESSPIVVILRMLRLARTMRLLKLLQFSRAAGKIVSGLQRSAEQILVFMYVFCTTAIILGALMYCIEGPENGFSSIAEGAYWAVVTLSTVGYGDVTPHTAFGRLIACFVMIAGYATLAVPALATVRTTGRIHRSQSIGDDYSSLDEACPECATPTAVKDATYCYNCGCRVARGHNRTLSNSSSRRRSPSDDALDSSLVQPAAPFTPLAPDTPTHAHA